MAFAFVSSFVPSRREDKTGAIVIEMEAIFAGQDVPGGFLVIDIEVPVEALKSTDTFNQAISDALKVAGRGIKLDVAAADIYVPQFVRI